jgi:hypothetical protein
VIVRARYREPSPVPHEAPSAEAQFLALAYVVEQSVEDGQYRSVAELARAFGVTRGRMSQLTKWRWSPIGQQERFLRL